MLKFVGAAFIIISGVMFGMYMSQKDKIRINELNCLKKALLILKSQINYSSEPLPLALHNIALRSDNPINHIFENISLKLKQKDKLIAEIWENEFRLYYSKEDLEVIKAFGKTLGYLDKQLQLNNIDLVIAYVDRTVESLAKKNEKDSKMYQSLGILGGLLLALLLM